MQQLPKPNATASAGTEKIGLPAAGTVQGDKATPKVRVSGIQLVIGKTVIHTVCDIAGYLRYFVKIPALSY